MESAQSRNKNRMLSHAMALVTIIMWSSAFPGLRYSLVYYSPHALMLLRFLFASATLAAIGAVRKIRLPERKDIPKFAGGGLVGIFLYMLLLNYGTVTVVSGVASFIIASAPVFTIILSRLILKEVAGGVSWIGVAVSFCGLVVIMLSQTAEFSFSSGVLLILGAAVATSAHNIIQRSFLKKYSPLEATTYTILSATAMMLVFAPALVRELPSSPPDVDLVVAYIGLFPAGLGYLTWNFALSKAEKTTHVTVFLYLSPFLSSLLGFFWLGETFSPWALLGGVVIIAGMVLTNLPGKDGGKGT